MSLRIWCCVISDQPPTCWGQLWRMEMRVREGGETFNISGGVLSVGASQCYTLVTTDCKTFNPPPDYGYTSVFCFVVTQFYAESEIQWYNRTRFISKNNHKIICIYF